MADRRDLLVLVNPAAGGGRAARLWPTVRQEAQRHFAFEEHWTRRQGEATTVARQAAQGGVRRILAVGGDGTLQEIANGLPDSRVALAALPVGTGNDFARVAGWTRPVRELLAGLAAGNSRIVDLGTVNGRRYLLVAGAGFDAAVAHKVHGMEGKGRGTLPYLATAVRQAFRFHPPALTLQLDDRLASAPRPLLMAAVANAPSYAGGMRICPPARLDDGLLHILTVGAGSGWYTLRLLGRVYRGAHLHDPGVHVASAVRVCIDGPVDVPLHADGEPVGHLPAVFEVLPGALRVWLSARRPTGV